MNNQNEAANTLVLIALFGVFAAIGIGVLLAALAGFVTLAAIAAQFKPVRLNGHLITGKDGRSFILYGIVGIILAVFLYGNASIVGHTPRPDFIPYVMVAGYTIGSIGITMMVHAFWGEDETAAPPPPAPPKVETTIEAKPRKVHAFADWQDDDDLDPYK